MRIPPLFTLGLFLIPIIGLGYAVWSWLQTLFDSALQILDLGLHALDRVFWAG